MNRTISFNKLFITPATLAAFLTVIGLAQYFSDVAKKERLLVPPTIIPEQAIKIGDLGLHAAAASIMWVYTIQQVTEHPDKLPELIENINAIDPKFSYPYAFAALTLPSFSIKGFPEKAVEIAERGILEADPDWRIPYYLATTYHILFQNRERASFYFDLATRTPGAPDKIKNIANLYGTAPNFREQTKQIWVSIYESSNDELTKERALNYLAQLEILDALDKAVLIYSQKYGRYPQKIEDLVTARILKEIPKSPLNSKFYLENGRIYVR